MLQSQAVPTTPFVKVAKTIRKFRDGILAAIRLKINNGRAEGLNNHVRLITPGPTASTPRRPRSPSSCCPADRSSCTYPTSDRPDDTHTHAGRASSGGKDDASARK